MMKNISTSYNIITISIFFSFLIIVNSQASCRVQRIPQIIPLQYGQQAMINLQQYFKGPNITISVEPNDTYSNIREQFVCRNKWSYQLGKILATETYQIVGDNKTQEYVAMLGGSAYFEDIYLMYYGIDSNLVQKINNQEQNSTEQNQSDKQINPQINGQNFKQYLSQNDILVLELPRSTLLKCKQFKIFSTSTNIEIVIDCFSFKNPHKKMFASTSIPVNSTNSSIPSKWQFIQSDIYIPQSLIQKSNIHSMIYYVGFSKISYLLRVVMNDYNDYIELWRWTSDSKQIINFYDKDFFIYEGFIKTNDIDIKMCQIRSNRIIILDSMNGLHIVDLEQIGKLTYLFNFPSFTFYDHFYYDSNLQHLFVGKRGQIQQYQVQWASRYQHKINRLKRYHLYGFEQIKQILSSNRFLYAITNTYTHVIHLTNIESNNQDYDGMYKVVQDYYVQKIIPTVSGFIKMTNLNSNVQLTSCQTHPPFLNIKTPKFSNSFYVKGQSMLNGQSQYCFLPLTTQYTILDEQKVYQNGHNSQNQTMFANRPGRSILQIQKFGLGKNLDYDLILINHKINFNYSISKSYDAQCQIPLKNQKSLENQKAGSNEFIRDEEQYLRDSNSYTSQSVGNWLIRQSVEKRVKQYFKCQKYYNVQCNLVNSFIYGPYKLFSEYQIIEQQKTRKQMIQDATIYANDNKTWVQINLISPLKQNQYTESTKSLNQTLCKIQFTSGISDISQVKLRQNKIYIVLSKIKQIRIYQPLLSEEEDKSCRYLGTISVSSFKNPPIYFSPKHIDFDKQNLNYPYLVPSFSFLFNKNPPTFTSQFVQNIFVTQFNEILVLRLNFNTQKLTRITLLKQSVIDRGSQTDNISLIVTLPYILAVDYSTKGISQYYFTHTFDSYYIKTLSFWYDNNTNPRIQLLNSNSLATFINPGVSNKSLVQVYKLNSLVSQFKQFTKFQVQQRNFQIMAFNNGLEFQFIQIINLANLEVKCKSRIVNLQPYLQLQIQKKLKFDEPSKQQFYLSLFTQLNVKRHILTLQVASDSSSIDKGPTYPYQTYGIHIEDDQQEAQFTIDDSKWFKGNIFTQRYNCQDCKNGKIKFQNKLSLKNEIRLQSSYKPQQLYVHKWQQNQNQTKKQFQIETIQGYMMTRIKPQQVSPWLEIDQKLMFQNKILPPQQSGSFPRQQFKLQYSLSQSVLLSSNMENDPECIKAEPRNHNLYFVSMCEDYTFLDSSSTLQIRLYSMTGFKTFVIDEVRIEYKQQFNLNRKQQPGVSTSSQKQLLIISSQFNKTQLKQNQDVLLVRFYDNIWIYLIVDGKLELIETVDQIDYGEDNHLCWIDLIERNINSKYQVKQNDSNNNLQKLMTQYGLICSLCQSGLYYMVFSIHEPANKTQIVSQKRQLPYFQLVSQQHINLNLQLQKQKIQLPNLAFFLQVMTESVKQDQTVFILYTIIQNFNSFVWRVILSPDTLAISGMQLQGVIKRYNSYSPIQITASGDRYFSVLYKSTQKQLNVTEFLGVYDKNDYVLNTQTYIKQYYFYIAQKTNVSSSTKSQIAQINDNLFVLKQNVISIYETFNLIKVHVQRKIPNTTQSTRMGKNIQDQNHNENQLKIQKPDNIRAQPGINDLNEKLPTQLYTQSIIIFVETPTQVNSVTIKLFAVDYFQLTGWQIFLIVFASLVIFIILGFIFKVWWKIYQKRRRLVKLQTTYLQDQQSSDKQSQQRKSSQEYQDDSRENRQSQITTSDSPYNESVLQKNDLNTPLIK